ncbi:Flagellar protein FliO [Buchnera aphidicola (Cinara piceae)]|uniref:Flagellar protein FliO, partial n=1 Tax=Buchnera aphidicola (Cinara piceae) TaxID=1660043 RepID=A0A803FTB7_9GAMM|nr:flagellar biosynthetic protein FliO [Buchnera aphidicola]VFP87886.1 Flagellar protein FliO [Buchnera aphidicola (Cinara piceae)]
MELYSYIQFSKNYNIQDKIWNQYNYISMFGKKYIYFFLFLYLLFLLITKCQLFCKKNNCIDKIYMIDKIYLSPTQYIGILYVNDNKFLLGITTNSINLIKELPPNKINFLKKQKKYSLYTFFLNIFQFFFNRFK